MSRRYQRQLSARRLVFFTIMSSSLISFSQELYNGSRSPSSTPPEPILCQRKPIETEYIALVKLGESQTEE